jgi:hypothetical protein
MQSKPEALRPRHNTSHAPGTMLGEPRPRSDWSTALFLSRSPVSCTEQSRGFSSGRACMYETSWDQSGNDRLVRRFGIPMLGPGGCWRVLACAAVAHARSPDSYSVGSRFDSEWAHCTYAITAAGGPTTNPITFLRCTASSST